MQNSDNAVRRRRDRSRVQGGWASLPTPTLSTPSLPLPHPARPRQHPTPPQSRDGETQQTKPTALSQGQWANSHPLNSEGQGLRSLKLHPGGDGKPRTWSGWRSQGPSTASVFSAVLVPNPLPTTPHYQHSQRVMVSRVPRNFSWVEEGLLCGLGFPDHPEHIKYLLEHNVRHLVSLTQDRVAPTHDFPDLCVVRIGIRDFTAPTLDQIKQFLEVVHQAKKKQEAVAVHCNMGKGRTGTLLACFLVARHNFPSTHALRQLRTVRPGSVQTPQQQQCVQAFEDYFKTGMCNNLSDWT